MAERIVRIITKRTSVPGKIPTGTTGTELNFIKTGELASNLADKKLYSYDGSNVFEYGSNSFLGLTGGTISGDVQVVGKLSVTGLTNLSGGLNVNSITASTYYNLPISKPYIKNKSEIVTGTTVGNDFNTGIIISATPISGSYVAVTINGLNAEVGNGLTTKDCYFSSDGTSSGVRQMSAITSGDYFMWNTNIAGYYLDATDSVSFYYNILE